MMYWKNDFLVGRHFSKHSVGENKQDSSRPCMYTPYEGSILANQNGWKLEV